MRLGQRRISVELPWIETCSLLVLVVESEGANFHIYCFDIGQFRVCSECLNHGVRHYMNEVYLLRFGLGNRSS
jgi:hypothetical protein